MFRKLALVSALVLSLSGCGLVSVTDANHMDHGMMDDNNSQYSSNDLMFAQMMIPHHQQAIVFGAHSGFAPENLTTSRQRWTSAATNRVNSSDVLPAGIAPSAAKNLRTSSLRKA